LQNEFSRTDRVAGQIQRVMAELIRNDLADPRIGMVSITDVKITRDLSHCKIYVSALEMAGSDTQTSVDVLNGASALLRHGLGKNIKFRVLPQIRFIADETERQAVEMDATIRAARAQDDAAAARRGES
jgi:ribosome-binding factor A